MTKVPIEGETPRVGLSTAAVLLGMLLNFGGLVWGAATLSESVKNLKETVGGLSTSMTGAIQTLNNQTAKTAVLEYRITALENANGSASSRK